MTQPRPSVRALLAAAAAEAPPSPELGIADLRAACEAGVLARLHLVRPVAPMHEVRELVSPCGVRVRLYLPTEQAASGPLHVHLHGGGWWMNSSASVDPMARELAVGLGAAVATVDYALAPEQPWPAAPEQVYEVVCWLAEAFEVLSVGGESAGANLAAVVCLMARDRGGPRIAAQWLDVACVDLRMPDSPSMRDFGTGLGIEAAQLAPMVAMYGGDPTHPYVSPALADLTGLPPALVTVAELDPLRDQAEAFAAALAAAGVPVEVRRAPGHVHGSSWLTGLDDETGRWHDDVVARFRSLAHSLEVSA